MSWTYGWFSGVRIVLVGMVSAAMLMGCGGGSETSTAPSTAGGVPAQPAPSVVAGGAALRPGASVVPGAPGAPMGGMSAGGSVVPGAMAPGAR